MSLLKSKCVEEVFLSQVLGQSLTSPSIHRYTMVSSLPSSPPLSTRALRSSWGSPGRGISGNPSAPPAAGDHVSPT